jgi:hypothetical protein
MFGQNKTAKHDLPDIALPTAVLWISIQYK